jgi:hypothetical protein
MHRKFELASKAQTVNIFIDLKAFDGIKWQLAHHIRTSKAATDF